MISSFNKKQQQQQNPKQTQFNNNCLFKFGKSKLLSSLNNSTTSLDSEKTFKSTMSSMTAELHAAAAAGKAVKTTTMKPPMEAVVVNSIIYSKPSFCSIVVKLGCGSITGEVPMAKDKMPKNGFCPNKTFTNEGFHTPRMIKSSLTSFASECLAGFNCPPPPPPLSMAAQTKDAQVYSLCTTINGSIHHQMSDICDNLLAMAGYFNHASNQHDNDDDSVIEFAYDDGDYDQDVIENEEDFDDEEETDDEEDDLDVEYNNNLIDYGDEEDDDDADYLHADKDIVDFSYKCSTENTPIFNCDKRKKVRFNTKPTVHVMHTWNYAYRAARKGQWEMHARDRERFRLRVQRASLILNPILEREHRQKIFEKRFVNIVDHFDEQKQLQQPTVEVKSEVKQNAEKIKAINENKTESKNIYQKKKRKKRRRFCKMGNKHYF